MGIKQIEKLPRIDEVKSSINKDNIIGKGGNAYVFDFSDEYVIRVQTRFTKNSISFYEKPVENSDMFEGKNFGQPVANYGKYITLLKKQKGEALHANLTDKNSEKLKWVEKSDELYLENLKTYANASVEAYKNLLEDIKFLNKKEFLYDPSKPNNLLYNKENDKFGFCDISTDNPNKNKQDCVSIPVMLFFNYYGGNRYKGEEKVAIINKRKILKKFQTAVKETKSFTNYNYAQIRNDSSLNFSLEQAAYSDDEKDIFYKTLLENTPNVDFKKEKQAYEKMLKIQELQKQNNQNDGW